MLSIQRITKTYANTLLLDDVSLTVRDGEIMCLLGPSGSGKTTLLRIIAGLEQPESGDIFFDGQNMRDVPVHQRHFGMMFQDLALFPHKNVFENVAFGLRMHNASREQVSARVRETLELVDLTGLEERNVNNLSGGEQQRVALARSLAPHPRLLMFDEPLGALDRILREQLIADVRAILKRVGMTALYVTHDQDEAFAIADRIAIIHETRLMQIGTPEEIYRAPANAFVAQFLGMTNLFPAKYLADNRVECALGIFAAPPGNRPTNPVVLVRPASLQIAERGIRAIVQECTFHAGIYRLRVRTEQGAMLTLESKRGFGGGDRIELAITAIELLPA